MSPNVHHHPPFCITTHLPAATSLPANDNDNEPNPQCHVTANGTSEEATEGGWEGIQAEGGDTGRGGGAGEQQQRCRSPNFCQQWGAACVTHTLLHSHSFTPPSLGGIIDNGGGVSPTRRPPFNFIYPPSLGEFFSCVVNDDGGGM